MNFDIFGYPFPRRRYKIDPQNDPFPIYQERYRNCDYFLHKKMYLIQKRFN